MKDRIPKYPGRVTLTPVEGQANTFDMVRADEPEQEGTPLNKTTLLTDETASLFGLGEDATVDDVLTEIPKMVNTAAKIATGSYSGTGKYGSANPCTITLNFAPKFVMVYEADMGHLTGFEYYLDSNAPDELFYEHSNTLIAAYGANEASRYSRNWNISTDHFTWGGNSFSWYTTGSNMDAEQQLNKSGTTYYYIAIG